MKSSENKQQLSSSYLSKSATVQQSTVMIEDNGERHPTLTLNLRDVTPLIDHTTVVPNGAGIRSVFVGSYNGLSVRAPIVMKLPEGIEEKLYNFKQPGYSVETMYCLQEELGRYKEIAVDQYFSLRPHFVMFTTDEMKAATTYYRDGGCDLFLMSAESKDYINSDSAHLFLYNINGTLSYFIGDTLCKFQDDLNYKASWLFKENLNKDGVLMNNNLNYEQRQICEALVEEAHKNGHTEKGYQWRETFVTKLVDVQMFDEKNQAVKFCQAVLNEEHEHLGYKDSDPNAKSPLILHGGKVSPNNLNLAINDNPPTYFRSVVTNHDEKKTVITIHRIVDSVTTEAIENKIKSLPKDAPITLATIPDLFAEFKLPELDKIKVACVELVQEKVLQQAKEAKDAQDAKNAAEAKAIKDVEEAKAALENQTKVNLLKEKCAEYLRHLDPKWQPNVQNTELSDEKEDVKLLPSNANVDVDKLTVVELLQLKKKIVNDMYNELAKNKKPEVKLENVRAIIEAPNNKEILAKNRDNAGVIFLKLLASFFTLGLAALKLFAVRGEKLSKNTTTILDAKPSKKRRT